MSHEHTVHFLTIKRNTEGSLITWFLEVMSRVKAFLPTGSVMSTFKYVGPKP